MPRPTPLRLPPSAALSPLSPRPAAAAPSQPQIQQTLETSRRVSHPAKGRGEQTGIAEPTPTSPDPPLPSPRPDPAPSQTPPLLSPTRLAPPRSRLPLPRGPAPSPSPWQASVSGQRRCWLSGTVQRSGSPAHGLPVSGSKQRRWRCCSEASMGAEVGDRPAGCWSLRSSRAVLEAGASRPRGRQGPQGDHSDQPLRGRRPRKGGL